MDWSNNNVYNDTSRNVLHYCLLHNYISEDNFRLYYRTYTVLLMRISGKEKNMIRDAD